MLTGKRMAKESKKDKRSLDIVADDMKKQWKNGQARGDMWKK